MSVIVKKIRGREYVYFSLREGERVLHKYIGPVGSPTALSKLREKSETSSIPPRLRPLFWDARIDKIHIGRNARYIIERILELGDVDAIEWLQRVYPTKKIIDVLHMSRQLTEKSRNFWTIWFGTERA